MNPNGGTLDTSFFPKLLCTSVTQQDQCGCSMRYHEPGSKLLLENTAQMATIRRWRRWRSIATAFNHPNVPPFVCNQLIQRLVKSILHLLMWVVARVFVNDGKGIRGNMAAVLRNTLDDEARTCEWLEDEHNGQLREPILRYSHFITCRWRWTIL